MTEHLTGLRKKQLEPQPSIRDRISDSLRASIISGEMAPNRVYSAPALADLFGVSATPVREAMVDLAREGLVVPMRNRGFRITEVSSTTLYEVAQIRQMLEPPAVETATLLIPEHVFPRLRDLADRIIVNAEEGDLVSYLTVDLEFHLAIIAYAGNAQLVGLVRQLRSQTRLYGLKNLVEAGQLPASAQEHIELLAAIEARDAALARHITHTHIGRVGSEWAGAAPVGSD